MANPGNPNQQQALYDQPNCDYEPPKNFQNFGNPYDCPEGMYGGSMVSSGVGYSQVRMKTIFKSFSFDFFFYAAWYVYQDAK